MNWNGVMPAITTCFDSDLSVNHSFMAKHCQWLLEAGCTGIVPLGSLGEGATLSFEEKVQIVRTCVGAVKGSAPVIASISALSTSEAVALAKGTTEDANPHRIAIFRTINGKRQAAAFDLTSIRRGQAQDPPVYAGDIIVVDGSSVKATEKRILQSIPLLAIFGPL